MAKYMTLATNDCGHSGTAKEFNESELWRTCSPRLVIRCQAKCPSLVLEANVVATKKVNTSWKKPKRLG